MNNWGIVNTRLDLLFIRVVYVLNYPLFFVKTLKNEKRKRRKNEQKNEK